ncbi:MAG: FMN-binding glutamate synthase family protein [Bacillota bacterium]
MTPLGNAFVAGLAGGAAVALVAGLGVVLMGPAVTRRMTGRLVRHLGRDPYGENLAELAPTLRKVGMVELIELTMRAEQGGKPPSRPFGSQRVFSPWEQLLLNPVYLHRMPTRETSQVETSTVIGPAAGRPLRLVTPIMIAGMSFGGALSSQAKVALARGASLAGTATNTGEAYLAEERQAAERLIIQYHRGAWPNSPQNRRSILTHADAIEIQVGQGAQASTPQTTPADKMDEEMRRVFGLKPGEDAVIQARLDGVDSTEAFRRLVRELKREYQVPVGLKFGATHHQERELEVALDAGVDFVVVDGAEGGTHGASPTLEDDTGLPTMHALVRTVRYLDQAGKRNRVSVIAAGGLRTPGQFLKAMALGADAVYVGTAAVMAMVGTDAGKVMPFEPPTQLALHSARLKDRLDVDQAATRVANFINASTREMALTAQAMGKTALQQLRPSDLVALDPQTAAIAGVELAYQPVLQQGQRREMPFRTPDLVTGSADRAEEGQDDAGRHPVH